MTYAVNFSKHAFHDLEKIQEPYYTRIKQAIRNLAHTPRPAGCKKLQGIHSYRIRVGRYRVIYDVIDRQLVITVIAIGDRKDVYR
ncbi:MAG: type II toxin-antitoxin system RelE/ParE family toxin [Prevotellaceae bacterium]|jgi:mRNA interferase RelE/StbE|nr:type II toxin-antitoxin system RelE/ParE family toxin [Prevotellaceae bacterium]